MLPVRRTAGLGPTLGAALALAMLVGACSSPGGSSIGVTGAWVRAAAMTAPSTAAYMTIANPGSAGDALVGVSSAVATTAEVHETMVVAASATPAASDGMGGASPMPGASAGGGMMGMQPVARLEIPAGGVVVLEPGSYHVMLIGLKQDLKAGDSVTLSLTFEKAGTVTVTAPVRES
jgi:copper(I)-binding protein